MRLIIGSCFISRKDLCLGAAGDQGWGSGGGCFGGSRGFVFYTVAFIGCV